MIKVYQKTIEVQIKAKQNDEQVAVVYFTMVSTPCPSYIVRTQWYLRTAQSTMLILFSDLDAVFDQGEMQKQFRDLLSEVEGSVQAFGSFLLSVRY